MGIDIPKGQMLQTEEKTYPISISESRMKSGKEWIKQHPNVQVMDTPLWVLISLGMLAMQEMQEEKPQEKKYDDFDRRGQEWR